MTGVTVFHGGPWDGQVWHGAAVRSAIPVPGAPPPPPAAWAGGYVDARVEAFLSTPPPAGRYELYGQPIPIGPDQVVVIFRWRPAVTGPPPVRPELPVWELQRLVKLMFEHPDLADHG